MYKHIFDRSNLDEVVAVAPKATHPENRQITRRMDLEDPKWSCPRNDIVLLNGTRSGHQYSLHVTMDGFAGDTWILDMLTDEEYEQVWNIAKRMRQNAEAFPPAMKLIVDDPGVSH